jgi:predicted Zn-dependent peptidase
VTTTVDRSRLPLVGADPSFRFPEIVHHTLPNGVAIRTIEHPSVPVITFVVQIDGGSGADAAGYEGLAAITADMVDEGTGGLSAIDVSDALAGIGAQYDVDVGADAVVFTLTTLSRFADRGAALLASMLTTPSLREEDFNRVRQIRLDRLLQLKDLPPAVAERAFLKLLYAEHPYGHLAIGTDAALRRITLNDVAGFHHAAFHPSRATIVVVGTSSHDELRGIVDRAFGPWTADTSAASLVDASVIDARRSAPRLAMVAREGAAQSELRLGQLAVRRNTPDYHALLVLNALLGGQFVSRINLKLREEKGFTYGVRTGFDWRRGLAPFTLQTSVHTAATAEAVRDALTELDVIRGAKPPTDGEMSLAKASLTRGYPRNFETSQQVARSIAQLALYGLPDGYFEQFIPRVNAVTTADVTRVATQYLDPSRITTLVVGDHGTIADSMDALGLGAPVVLSAA